MSVFKRKYLKDGEWETGKTWWYKFRFDGVEIRSSTKIPVTGKNGGKQKALDAEKQRRRELEDSHNGLKKKPKAGRFVEVAQTFIDEQLNWKKKTRVMHTLSLNKHLKPYFGDLLVKEITAERIKRYQVARVKECREAIAAKEAKAKSEGKTVKPIEGIPPYNRTINIEVSLIRMVLRKYKLWEAIKDEVTILDENEDIGRELTDDEAKNVLDAVKASASRSLYPAVLTSIHTGLRSEELRLLKWHQVDLIAGEITVGKSKTQGGKGRVVPLSHTALQVLTGWRSQFPNAQPDHYVFPSEKYALKGKEGVYGGEVVPYQVNPDKPMGSWKRSWTTAKREAGKAIAKAAGIEADKASPIECRWHDLRHTAASIISAAGTPDSTMQEIFGWEHNSKMAKRYSHVRAEAKRTAVAVFDSNSSVQ